MACEFWQPYHCYASLTNQIICRSGSFQDCEERKNFESGIDWKSKVLEEVTENLRTGRIWKRNG